MRLLCIVFTVSLLQTGAVRPQRQSNWRRQSALDVADSMLDTLALLENDECDESWTFDPDSSMCFSLFAATRRDWFEALDKCGDMGATLATVKSESTNVLVQDLVAKSGSRYSPWLGGRIYEYDGEDDWTVTWSQDTTMTTEYFPWATKFPKHVDTVNCLKQNKWGKWRHKDCSAAQPFVCMKLANPLCDVANCEGCIEENYCAQCSPGYEDIYQTGKCQDLAHACTDGWILNRPEMLCYQKVEDRVDFPQAIELCTRLQSSLVPIHSEPTNDFIKKTFSGSMWVGIKYDYDAAEWVYIDSSSAVTFTNWALRYPTECDVEKDDCCVMVGEQGQWKNERCSKYLPFICRRHWNY